MIRVFKNPIHKVKEAAAMKIIESAQKCNPEQIARNMNSIVDQLKSAVESAARDGDSYDSVERKTLETVLQIGFHALQLLLALQGDGDLGEEVDTANEKIAKRSEAKSTTRLFLLRDRILQLLIAVVQEIRN